MGRDLDGVDRWKAQIDDLRSSAREVTNEGTIVGTSQWGRGSTTVVNGGVERTFNVSAWIWQKLWFHKGFGGGVFREGMYKAQKQNAHQNLFDFVLFLFGFMLLVKLKDITVFQTSCGIRGNTMPFDATSIFLRFFRALLLINDMMFYDWKFLWNFLKIENQTSKF